MDTGNLTGIGSFGDEITSSGGLIRAEIDAEMHADADGNLPGEFAPDTEVFFLVHTGPRVTIVGVQSYDDGDIQRIATVTRTATAHIEFEDPAKPVELPYLPASPLTVLKWYGRTSVLTLDGRMLTAAGAPCRADISYQYTAVQYSQRLATGWTLNDDGKFFAAARIEYTVAE